MSARICPSCGDALPLQTGRGGRRRYCLKCSPPRYDPRNKPRPVPVSTNVDMSPIGNVHNVSAACLAELRAAGVTTSWQAAVCMVLARRIDGNGQEPGGALASLVKVLQLIMADALARGAERNREPDPLEEIRARVLSTVRD